MFLKITTFRRLGSNRRSLEGGTHLKFYASVHLVSCCLGVWGWCQCRDQVTSGPVWGKRFWNLASGVSHCSGSGVHSSPILAAPISPQVSFSEFNSKLAIMEAFIPEKLAKATTQVIIPLDCQLWNIPWPHSNCSCCLLAHACAFVYGQNYIFLKWKPASPQGKF